MLKRVAVWPRMPARSLLVATLVGVLVGCGGGGGGGGSEPAPTPVAPEAQIVWQPTNFEASVAPLPVSDVNAIEVSPDGRVLVGWTSREVDPVTKFSSDQKALVSRSDDGGATWSTVRLERGTSLAGLLRLSTGLIVAAGTIEAESGGALETGSAGIWTSADNGATWQARRLTLPARDGLPTFPLQAVSALAERNGEVVLVRGREYVAEGSPIPGFDVLAYLWNPVTDAVSDWSLAYGASNSGVVASSVAVAADGTVFVAPYQIAIIKGQGYGATVLRSSNGLSWEPLAPFDNLNVSSQDLAILTNGMLLYAHYALHRSVDGRTWIEPEGISVHGDNYGAVTDIFQLASGAVTSDGFSLYSCDSGATWKSIANRAYGVVGQGPNGTLWSVHNRDPKIPEHQGTHEVVKAVPPAGVAARDFVKCP